MARYTVYAKGVHHYRTLRAALDVAYSEAVATGRPVIVRVGNRRRIKVTPRGRLLTMA